MPQVQSPLYRKGRSVVHPVSQSQNCLYNCSCLNSVLYCTLKAICAIFCIVFYTITLLQEGTEQLLWRSNRIPNSGPVLTEKRGILKKCLQPEGITELAPSPGQARVQLQHQLATAMQAGKMEEQRAAQVWILASISEAYKALLHPRQPREGLTQKKGVGHTLHPRQGTGIFF